MLSKVERKGDKVAIKVALSGLARKALLQVGHCLHGMLSWLGWLLGLRILGWANRPLLGAWMLGMDSSHHPWHCHVAAAGAAQHQEVQCTAPHA